jgi:predicted amidohydrolase YtcJ
MTEKADLVLYNANIITFDPAKPRATTVAVRDGNILRVAGNGAHEHFTGRRINCNGKTLIPGFNDAHCHIFAFASSLLSVDCTPSSVSSIADIKDLIRKRVQTASDGEWIRAFGYDEFNLADRRHPNRFDLDEAAPNHPVKLMHRSRHACVLNSRAMSLVGITNETQEPEGGVIDRDLQSGQPSGMLFEMNDYIETNIPPISSGEMERGVRLANDTYLSQGITSIQDATASNNIKTWKLFQRLRESDSLKPRLSLMIGMQYLEELLAEGLTPRHGDNDMRLGALKVIISEARGCLYPDMDELRQMVAKADSNGFQIAIHAIEENTVEAAVSALESIYEKSQKDNHRHRIEHCSVCPDSLLDRIENVRALVVTQPSFIYYSGERYLETVSEEQLPLLYRISSFLKSGLKPSAGSDNPVAPLNPLLSMHAAVNRRTQKGDAFFSRERVLPSVALEMHTRAAAYASFDEAVKGTISPGKLADFTILSDDPLKIAPEKIRDIKVDATIVGGEVVWRS